MSDKVIVYGHPLCPGMGPVRGILSQAKVEFDYINIHQDEIAAEWVRTVNHGYESVPTLAFPDGTTLTEPSVRDLKTKLESLGYQVGPSAWLIGNIWRIVIIIGVGLALLKFLEII